MAAVILKITYSFPVNTKAYAEEKLFVLLVLSELDMMISVILKSEKMLHVDFKGCMLFEHF